MALPARIGRGPFLLVLLANFVLVQLLRMITGPIGTDGWHGIILPLLYAPSFLAAVPRLHDNGHGGWMSGLVFLLTASSGFLIPYLTAVWTSYDPQAPHAMFLSPVNVLTMVLNIATIRLLFLCWQRGDWDANGYGPPVASSDAPPPPPDAPLRAPLRTPLPTSASRRTFGQRS